MNKINKDNLTSFLEYYFYLHDSFIADIKDFDNKIELIINVFWSGKTILKEDNTYETNQTKLRIVLNNIERRSDEEDYFSDYIDEVFISFIKLNNKEYICFASDKKEPSFYAVCESMEYEELKICL